MSVLDAMEFQPDARTGAGRQAADVRPDPGFFETAAASFRLTRDDSIIADVRDREDSYNSLMEALPPASQKRVQDIVRASLTRGRVGASADPNIRYGLIWQEVERARQSDPKAFKSLPRTADEFETQILDRAKRSRAVDRDKTSRGGTVANLSGGVVGSFTDPINVGSMAISGGGGGLALTMAREAAINAGVELFEVPFISHQRKRYGEEYTGREIAANVAGAAGAGALFAGAAKGAEIGIPKAIDFVAEKQPLDRRLARALESDVRGTDLAPPRVSIAQAFDASDHRELAGAIRTAIPEEARTPEVAEALHVLDRNADIDESSPFIRTYAGDAAHRANLQAAMDGLDGAPPPAAPRRRRTTGTVLANDVVTFFRAKGYTEAQSRGIAAGIAAESRSDHNIRGGYKGRALGLGQWLGDRRAEIIRRYGENPTREQQLEFLHYELQGGDAGGKAVLAAGDERAVLDAYINKFMRPAKGAETTGDLSRGMEALGRAGEDLPTLREELFAGDADALSAAQRAADDAELEARAAHARNGENFDELARLTDDTNSPEPSRVETQDETPDDFLFQSKSETDAPQRSPEEWPQIVERLRSEKGGEVPAALYHPATGPIDVVWGEVGRGKSEGFGLAKIVEKHPEVVADLPAILRGMEVASESPNRVRLESRDHRAAVSLNWHGDKKTWLLTAYKREDAPASAVDERADALGRDDSPGLGASDAIPEQPLKINEPAAAAPILSGPRTSKQLELFTDPNGEGARLTAESLSHDVAMLPPEGSFRLSDEVGETSAANALRKLDEQDAEIASIRECLVPPKAGKADE